jgi:hypothetical protein
MPTVYRIQCETCGKGPDITHCLAGWVTTDGSRSGVVLPEGYVAVKLDGGEFKPLPHPAETSTLKSLGYNWDSAAKQGRLYRVAFKICKKCGTFHEERQHHNGIAGCIPGLITFPVAAIVAKLALKSAWISAMCVAYLSTVSVAGIVGIASWVRWRRANSQLRLQKCAKCAATEFMTIPKAKGKALICPHCGIETVHCTIAGKS